MLQVEAALRGANGGSRDIWVGVRQCQVIDRHIVVTVDSLTSRIERQLKRKRPL